MLPAIATILKQTSSLSPASAISVKLTTDAAASTPFFPFRAS